MKKEKTKGEKGNANTKRKKKSRTLFRKETNWKETMQLSLTQRPERESTPKQHLLPGRKVKSSVENGRGERLGK